VFVYTCDDGELTIETDYETVTGEETKPDTNWRFVDGAGHRHAFWSEDDPFPTLREKTRTVFCATCDCCSDEDSYEETYYVCRECSEEISPRFTTVPVTEHIKTRECYILKTVRRVTKEEALAWLSEQGISNVAVQD
jgi:hypothetical protein